MTCVTYTSYSSCGLVKSHIAVDVHISCQTDKTTTLSEHAKNTRPVLGVKWVRTCESGFTSKLLIIAILICQTQSGSVKCFTTPWLDSSPKYKYRHWAKHDHDPDHPERRYQVRSSIPVPPCLSAGRCYVVVL